MRAVLCALVLSLLRPDGVTRASAVVVAVAEHLGIGWSAMAGVDVTPFDRSGAAGSAERFGYLGSEALAALRGLAEHPAPPDPIVLDAPRGPRPLVRFGDLS